MSSALYKVQQGFGALTRFGAWLGLSAASQVCPGIGWAQMNGTVTLGLSGKVILPKPRKSCDIKAIKSKYFVMNHWIIGLQWDIDFTPFNWSQTRPGKEQLAQGLRENIYSIRRQCNMIL